MAKKETAEQKLLKIIEEGDKGEREIETVESPHATANSREAQAIAAAVKGSGIALPPLTSLLQGIFKSLPFSPSQVKTFGIREVNMLLIVFIIAGIILFSINFLRESKTLHADIQFAKDVKSSSMAIFTNIMPSYDDVTNFLEIVLRRNIFRPIEEKAKSAETNLGILVSEKIAEKIELQATEEY